MQNSTYSLVLPHSFGFYVQKIGLWFGLSMLLTGCWAQNIKPTSTDIDKLQSILIVPVESPPLEVTPDLLIQRMPVYQHYQNMALDFPLKTKLYQTAGGIAVAGLVSGDQTVDAYSSAQTGGDWTPAKAAALKAKNLLSAENLKSILSSDVYRLPTPVVSQSADLHQWHDAIQAWYGLEQTPVDYQPMGHFDAVMEVGIGGYRIFEGQTSLKVLIKLIDPVSRRVIARTSDDSFRVDDAAIASVDRGGEEFKQLIANMSVPLLRQCLGDVGLVVPVQPD